MTASVAIYGAGLQKPVGARKMPTPNKRKRKAAEAMIDRVLANPEPPMPKSGKIKMADIRAEYDALARELGFLSWSDFALCARRRRITLPPCPLGWEQERHTKPRKEKA